MYELLLHPDSAPGAVTAIQVEVTRPGPRQLALRYLVSGDTAAILLPRSRPSERADGLWQHTCFEAFLANPPGYLEFNFSPSTEWAAYRFDRYRDGMRPANIAAPHIEVRQELDRFELTAGLDLNGLGLDDLDWRLCLSAVVKSGDKSISYWALKHPPGEADFHDPACFALELPAAR